MMTHHDLSIHYHQMHEIMAYAWHHPTDGNVVVYTFLVFVLSLAGVAGIVIFLKMVYDLIVDTLFWFGSLFGRRKTKHNKHNTNSLYSSDWEWGTLENEYPPSYYYWSDPNRISLQVEKNKKKNITGSCSLTYDDLWRDYEIMR